MDFDYCEKHSTSLSNKILLWQCSEKQREKLIENFWELFPKKRLFMGNKCLTANLLEECSAWRRLRGTNNQIMPRGDKFHKMHFTVI